MNDLTLYINVNGSSQIKLRSQEQTFWPLQFEIGALFEATKWHISLYLKCVIKGSVLGQAATVNEFMTVLLATVCVATFEEDVVVQASKK